MSRKLDLFSGPRGWGSIGGESDGVEIDPAARATAEAVGFEHVHDDVRTFRLASDHAYIGLEASPVCVPFSQSGKMSGVDDLDRIWAALDELVLMGQMPGRGFFGHPDTDLVLEPMRVILEAWHMRRAFRWIVLEQVPQAQAVWNRYEKHLLDLGYFVATGYVNAVDFGVPQNRKRTLFGALSCPPFHASRHRPWQHGSVDGAGMRAAAIVPG